MSEHFRFRNRTKIAQIHSLAFQHPPKSLVSRYWCSALRKGRASGGVSLWVQTPSLVTRYFEVADVSPKKKSERCRDRWFKGGSKYWWFTRVWRLDSLRNLQLCIRKPTGMSQEVRKWLGSMRSYNPNIPHLQVGYNPFTNHWSEFPKGHPLVGIESLVCLEVWLVSQPTTISVPQLGDWIGWVGFVRVDYVDCWEHNICGFSSHPPWNLTNWCPKWCHMFKGDTAFPRLILFWYPFVRFGRCTCGDLHRS